MTAVAPIILSLILGWLATLTLQRERAEVLVLDFLIATFGAGLVAAPVALVGNFYNWGAWRQRKQSFVGDL